MNNRHLATYLNDHLAGSVTAVKLLAALQNSRRAPDVASFATDLRKDVLADQRELQGLMQRLRIPQSRMRKATGWLAEKLAELKLWMDDPAGGRLRTFETLELLEVGSEGKGGLWRALATMTEEFPELRGFDFSRLTQRADDQCHRVESLRLQTAKTALAN